MGRGAEDLEPVFRALADPTRRLLLDRLRARNGQTLGELCAELSMARQSATQHLDLLRDAGLVVVVRRGRERLHFLDPGPIHAIEQRWISAFDRPRLHAIDAITQRAEEYAMSERTVDEATVPTYVYVTYIRATAEQVWHALTDADLTASYWGHANVSDWQPGSVWEHRRTDGSGVVDAGGRVLEVDPPRRLVVTFGEPDEDPATASRATFLVEPHEGIVRLTVTHERLADARALSDVSQGWPAVFANLKSLLETGQVLPSAPWEMPTVSA
ncbi:metalloregulator ArsR/SmtB family transcription factor [Blastococcus sp. TF02A-26]|uniref:metalloregulator ArsR/SmtB family transcription factor n=1 Tax=Blastococcus sp. TF02A-26 TaxID=2250577 RepID=UPI001F1D5046|nr:metalloregulator ArsR/SmtB family transcription factor [Blastococcus sp. TF02A-26]